MWDTTVTFRLSCLIVKWHLTMRKDVRRLRGPRGWNGPGHQPCAELWCPDRRSSGFIHCIIEPSDASPFLTRGH